MIGIYTPNTNTQKQFLELFQDLGVVPYIPQHTYDSVIWLSDEKPPKNISLLASEEPLPLTFAQWRLLLQKQQGQSLAYINDVFSFDPGSRMVTVLSTKQIISLTEKETAFLSFLVQSPHHQASKEIVLQQVWRYSPSTETHTLESHLYALKQKLGADADKLIRFQDGIFFLV